MTSPLRTLEQSLSILFTLCFQIFIRGVDYLIILLKNKSLALPLGQYPMYFTIVNSRYTLYENNQLYDTYA